MWQMWNWFAIIEEPKTFESKRGFIGCNKVEESASLPMPLVGKGREGWFLLLFVIQFCVYTAILAYYENVVNRKDGLSTFVAVLGGMPGIIALSTASSIVLLEGLAMLSERYLKRRYEEGKEEAWRVWEDWNRRRIEAEEGGMEFDEPPPTRRNGGRGPAE